MCKGKDGCDEKCPLGDEDHSFFAGIDRSVATPAEVEALNEAMRNPKPLGPEHFEEMKRIWEEGPGPPRELPPVHPDVAAKYNARVADIIDPDIVRHEREKDVERASDPGEIADFTKVMKARIPEFLPGEKGGADTEPLTDIAVQAAWTGKNAHAAELDRIARGHLDELDGERRGPKRIEPREESAGASVVPLRPKLTKQQAEFIEFLEEAIRLTRAGRYIGGFIVAETDDPNAVESMWSSADDPLRRLGRLERLKSRYERHNWEEE